MEPSHTPRATVARRVRAARAYAGLSQAQLAARAHLDCASVRALKRGSYHVVAEWMVSYWPGGIRAGVEVALAPCPGIRVR
jgi:DNA-binding XRE family transcriptional regulator